MADGIIRQKQMADYLSASCFSPDKFTLLWAIKQKNFTSRPGMTIDLITKYFPKLIATAKGHLDQ